MIIMIIIIMIMIMMTILTNTSTNYNTSTIARLAPPEDLECGPTSQGWLLSAYAIGSNTTNNSDATINTTDLIMILILGNNISNQQLCYS